MRKAATVMIKGSHWNVNLCVAVLITLACFWATQDRGYTATAAPDAAHGIVVDEAGRPIAGAIIETENVTTDGQVGWERSFDFPTQVLSDGNGKFSLSTVEEFTRVQVRVRADRTAPRHQWIYVKHPTNIVELTSGCVVRGRVVNVDRKPVAGAKIGLAEREYNSKMHRIHYETTTDANGIFHFSHVPPNCPFYIYSLLESPKTAAITPRQLSTGKDSSTQELGDFMMTKPLRLAGRLKTRNGARLSDRLRLRLEFEKSADVVEIPVSTNGQFQMDGVYPDTLTVTLLGNDWHFSGANGSASFHDNCKLEGDLTGEKTDLDFLIEPGPGRKIEDWNGNGQLPTRDQPERLPLSGIESSSAIPITVSGVVKNKKTGAPVSQFRITPGYRPAKAGTAPASSSTIRSLLASIRDYIMPQAEAFDERTYWTKVYKEVEQTNHFTCYFKRISSSPCIKIEADGFEPVLMALPAYSQTNLNIQLVPQPGISGTVLLPDGKPATDVIIAYAAAREHFGLLNGVLTAYGGNNEALHSTDSHGAFSFPLRAEGKCLYVAGQAGWAFHKLSKNDQNLVLTVKPWANVSGAVQPTTTNTIAGITLAITMTGENSDNWQTLEPMIDLQARAITDSRGKFTFHFIPPYENTLLQRLIPSDEKSGWSYQPIAHVFADSENLKILCSIPKAKN